jgi:hypothetical protein
LRDIDATHVAIQIYDNNIPNETREITVDTANNTWTYPAISVDGVARAYSGDTYMQDTRIDCCGTTLTKAGMPFLPE